ncbi:S-adenosyl-L-methionine-dependent methyltransferases superfamily protein [Actinidia rufa]|uniref:S-adenosyl-L-methionine-dependent methyltransferases superfamily protein n=1 Tax=Actinidia rufa TaxID=165716 RepID=A0A7J0F4P0_9ERIC|nr:S-adenosyl-L-methionine-dependent methyltransferases superfamily protein [Actinidia rufa]
MPQVHPFPGLHSVVGLGLGLGLGLMPKAMDRLYHIKPSRTQEGRMGKSFPQAPTDEVLSLVPGSLVFPPPCDGGWVSLNSSEFGGFGMATSMVVPQFKGLGGEVATVILSSRYPLIKHKLLAMLVQILGAEKCIEVGVFTGYSSLAIALVLPESGRLVACERDMTCLEVAKRYYDRAGVSHKVDVKHGLAADALKSMIQKGETCRYLAHRA